MFVFLGRAAAREGNLPTYINPKLDKDCPYGVLPRVLQHPNVLDNILPLALHHQQQPSQIPHDP